MGFMAHARDNHEIKHFQLTTAFRPNSSDVVIKFVIAKMAKMHWKKDIAAVNREGTRETFRILDLCWRDRRCTGSSNRRKRDG